MKIELSQVSKFYGRTPALQEVSCQIEPGQVVAVLGPNGAGKSTLLRCLAGVVRPDDGHIFYDGEVFRRGRLDLRRRLHFLPDIPLVYGTMTLPEHLGLLFQLYEAPPDGREELVIRLWDELDLLPLYRRPMRGFSRGQLYKGALSGLIALEPELWLLDEPFASGMDPHGLAVFRRYARTAAERGATVIYTTQIVEVAERFADVVCLLDHGALRAFAGLETLRRQSPAGTGVLESWLESLRSDEEA